MKSILTLFIGLLFISGFSQSTTELNIEAGKSSYNATLKLTNMFNTILEEYKQDTLFTEKLKTSQNLWLSYRDAQIQTKYPEGQNSYGTIYSMCESIYREYLTNQRIETLQDWVDGIEEGDVCLGSVKVK